MQQNTKSSPRVWLYARLPGDELGTLNQLNFLRLRANLQNCTIVGTSIDTHRGWLHRSGYREMMRHVKSGDVDQVHGCRCWRPPPAESPPGSSRPGYSPYSLRQLPVRFFGDGTVPLSEALPQRCFLYK